MLSRFAALSVSLTRYQYCSISILDKILPKLTGAQKVRAQHLPNSSLWLGEAGSFFGGPTHQSLARSFAASFMFLDKLGLASRHGHSLVARQTLFGGS
eukprot:COSAG04_NODE_7295_length_1152_cov_1.180437_2_plen_97_part_01